MANVRGAVVVMDVRNGDVLALRFSCQRLIRIFSQREFPRRNGIG